MPRVNRRSRHLRRSNHQGATMTLHEEARERAKAKPLSFKEAARRRREAQAPQQSVPGFERVVPFPEWCRYKGVSLNTGKRWRKAGKIKVVQLSANRVGVTASADAEFMRSCESA